MAKLTSERAASCVASCDSLYSHLSPLIPPGFAPTCLRAAGMLLATARHRPRAHRLFTALQQWYQATELQHVLQSCHGCLHCSAVGNMTALAATALSAQHMQHFHAGVPQLPVLGTVLHSQLVQRATFAKAAKKKQDSKTSLPSDVFDSSAARQQMSNAVEYLEQELASVRTGRASAGLLDHIKVQVYGQKMPIKAAANISVRDAQTIVVTAFDPSTVSLLDKAIVSSALGLNPRTEGQELIVPVPRPTKETLAAMAKLINQSSESAKVKLRQTRKAAVAEAKKLASEDDQKRAEKQVQQLTDSFVTNVDQLCDAKQRELQLL